MSVTLAALVESDYLITPIFFINIMLDSLSLCLLVFLPTTTSTPLSKPSMVFCTYQTLNKCFAMNEWMDSWRNRKVVLH